VGALIETAKPSAASLRANNLRETEHGLIVTEANQFKFGNNHELQKTNILLVRKFLRDMMEAGIELPGGI
jgi:UDP-N-acetylmuramyl tripeptide synthase